MIFKGSKTEDVLRKALSKELHAYFNYLSFGNAAYIVGVRHSISNVVTAMVDDLHFLKPVRVGDLALSHGKVVFISHSSIRVKVDIERENPITGTREKALTAYKRTV
jgi:acyl-CoA hydrolase